MKRSRAMDFRYDRKQQGEIIARVGSIRRLENNTYVVTSQSGNGCYDVKVTEFGWNCSCPDSKYSIESNFLNP